MAAIIMFDTTVLIEVVFVLGIGVPADIPVTPAWAKGYVVMYRIVSIEVLAEHGRLVTGLLELHGKSIILVASIDESFESASIGGIIGKHTGIVWQFARENRRAGRTTERISYKVIRESRSLLLHGQDVRHILNKVPGQIVREYKDDVRFLSTNTDGKKNKT